MEKKEETSTSAFPRKFLPFPQVTSFLSCSFSLEHNVLPDIQWEKKSLPFKVFWIHLIPLTLTHIQRLATLLNCFSCPAPSSREGPALVKSPFNLHLYQTAGAASANGCCCRPRSCCPKAHWFSLQKQGSNICICDFCGFGSTSKHQDKRCVCYALFTKMLPAAREMGGTLLQS